MPSSPEEVLDGEACLPLRLVSRVWRTVFAILLVSLTACSSSPAGLAKPPDPGQVLRDAGSAMAGLQSAAIAAKFGPGITLQGLELVSASGHISRPSNSDVVVKVRRGDYLLDVRLITTGGHTYVRLPFASFTEVSGGSGVSIPDLSQVLDPGHGLPAVLPRGRDPKYAGSEQVSGVDCDHVDTTYSAGDIGQTLGGEVPVSDVKTSIFAGKRDHLVRRAKLSGNFMQGGKSVDVDLTLSELNKPVTVTPPAVQPPVPQPSGAPGTPATSPSPAVPPGKPYPSPPAG